MELKKVKSPIRNTVSAKIIHSILLSSKKATVNANYVRLLGFFVCVNIHVDRYLDTDIH